MGKKKTPLLTPVLWFITTGLWTINLIRYKNEKIERKEA